MAEQQQTDQSGRQGAGADPQLRGGKNHLAEHKRRTRNRLGHGQYFGIVGKPVSLGQSYAYEYGRRDHREQVGLAQRAKNRHFDCHCEGAYQQRHDHVGGPIRPAQLHHYQVCGKGAQQHKAAVGEVDGLGSLVDDNNTNGDQRIHCAGSQATDNHHQELRHAPPPPYACRLTNDLPFVTDDSRRTEPAAALMVGGRKRLGINNIEAAKGRWFGFADFFPGVNEGIPAQVVAGAL